MAIYRLSADVVKRSAGRCTTAAAAYRAGQQIADERLGQTFDYTRRSGVLHAEIMAPDNTPEWMRDRARLWNAVETVEKRKDAQLARDIELALPHELTHAQRVELVREFVAAEFVAKGMIADIALHAPCRHGDQRNHHAHILLTMRDLTSAGFGNKARGWNDKEQLKEWRASWAAYENRALERHGFAARVDHRSLEAQGIDREPQIHLGPDVAEMAARGAETDRGEIAATIDDRNAERDRLKAELAAIAQEILALERDQAAQVDDIRAATVPPRDTGIAPEPVTPEPPDRSAARLLDWLRVATSQPEVTSETTGGEHGTSTRKIVAAFVALCHDPLHDLPRWLDAHGRRGAGGDRLLARPGTGVAGDGDVRPVRGEDGAGRTPVGAATAAKDTPRMDERPSPPPEPTLAPVTADPAVNVDDQAARTQAQRQVDVLAAMEQQAKQAEAVRRQVALFAQMERQEQARRAFVEEQAALAATARDSQAQRPEDPGRSNGDIADAKNRYAQALGEEYSISDPYGSLGRAAMSEYGKFMKQQEALTQQIAAATDPAERRSLELRKEIEGADYMAITSTRLAGMSRVVTGNLNSDQAQRDEAAAKLYQARATELRAERAQLGKERTAPKAEEPAPLRQEAPARQAVTPIRATTTPDRPAASPREIAYGLPAENPGLTPTTRADWNAPAKRSEPVAPPPAAPSLQPEKPQGFLAAARQRVVGFYQKLTASSPPPARTGEPPTTAKAHAAINQIQAAETKQRQQDGATDRPSRADSSSVVPSEGAASKIESREERTARVAAERRAAAREPGQGNTQGSGRGGGRGGGGNSR
jgi:hypothetical protein